MMIGSGALRLPSSSTVQLHPVVLAIFELVRISSRLGEEITEEVVIGGILESKISNIAQVFVEFLCERRQSCTMRSTRDVKLTWKTIT